MSENSKSQGYIKSLQIPKISIIYYGQCKVNFAWKFHRDTPFWFLYYNPTPGARLTFGRQEIYPDENKVLLIPPHTTFTTACEVPFEHFYIHFAVEKPFTDVKPEPLLFDYECCGKFIEKLCRSGFEKNPVTVSALLYTLLSQVPEEHLLSDVRRRDDKISIALTNFNTGKSNTQLSAMLGMSPGNFQRRFKQEMGMTPKQYALHLRLEEAEEMLRNSDQSISEIAGRCGFSDRYAFSKAFKKYSGCSPAAYRNLPQISSVNEPDKNSKSNGL